MNEVPPICRASLVGSVLRLETRPGQAWLAVGVIILLLLGLIGYAVLHPDQPGPVLLALIVGGFLVVALAGAIGAVRSYYRMVLDLEAATIQAEEVRMFGRKLTWEGTLDEVYEIQMRGRQLRIVWQDANAHAVTGVFAADSEAQAAASALDAALGAQGS